MILAALVVVWTTSGLNPLGFKVAEETIPPLDLIAGRMLLASFILLPLALAWGGSGGLSRRQLRSAVTAGLLLLVCGQGALAWGVQYLPAGVTAVFACSAPLWLAVFGFLFQGQKITGRTLAGLLLGFAGLAVLALSAGAGASLDPLAVGVVLAGAASWALGSIYSSQADMPANAGLSTAIQMLTVGLVFLLLAFVTHEAEELSFGAISERSWIGFLDLVIFGSLVGFGTFTWLNRRTTTALANTFNYVAPVITLTVSHLLLDEPLTAPQILACILALGGVALIVSGSRREA